MLKLSKSTKHRRYSPKTQSLSRGIEYVRISPSLTFQVKRTEKRSKTSMHQPRRQGLKYYKMRDVASTAAILFCTTVLVVLGTEQFCQFFNEYNKISAKIESEKKLLERCKEPEFFMDLHTHTDVCIAVQNNARIGAFMLALHEVTGASHLEGAVSELALAARALGWPMLCVGLVVMYMCPCVWSSLIGRRDCGERSWRCREHVA